ncbi:hypothetical protein HSX11_05975 [Oxalobacteraceae bacterium]|nr:hypothetical protein [Oxalobacteraceae bacterium]
MISSSAMALDDTPTQPSYSLRQDEARLQAKAKAEPGAVRREDDRQTRSQPRFAPTLDPLVPAQAVGTPERGGAAPWQSEHMRNQAERQGRKLP